MGSEHKRPGSNPKILLLFLICVMFINHYLCASFPHQKNRGDSDSTTDLTEHLWGLNALILKEDGGKGLALNK